MTVMSYGGRTYSNGNVPSSVLGELLPSGIHGTSRRSKAYIRKDAADSWNRLAKEAEKLGVKLSVRGWNRTYAEQSKFFYERYTRTNTGRSYKTVGGVRWYLKPGYASAAYPGYSNHGWGLAVDINDFGGVGEFNNPRRKKVYHLLIKHGWTETEGRRVNEPWHWVYDPSKDKGKNAVPSKPKKRRPHRINPIKLGDKTWRTGLVQEYLKNRGLYKGKIDDRYGRGTETAVKEWQKAVKLPVTGRVGKNDWYRMCLGSKLGDNGGPRTEIVQRMLGLVGNDVDRKAGSVYKTRMMEVQRWLGVPADADCGAKTVAALMKKG